MVLIDPEARTWDRTAYAVGFRARLSETLASGVTTHSWRCGWEDADVELLESARHQRVLADGGKDDFEETWGLLFDAGGDARVHGIEFDENRTQPWKEGWIDADINLGARGL